MALGSLWSPALRPELSQGDVLTEVPTGTSVFPPQYLVKGPTQKGGKTSWDPSPTWVPVAGGSGHFLAAGRVTRLLIASHDCEIDKKPKGRVLVIPIDSIESVQQSHRGGILAGEHYSIMPLLGLAGEDCFANLRMMTYVEKTILSACTRIASMTDDGVESVQRKFIAFFSRKDFGTPAVGVNSR